MAKRSAITPLNNAEARARLSEARPYLETAELYVASISPAERKVSGSNAILAGIAAADSLRRLLSEKTPVQYGVQPVSLTDAAQLLRWARDVVDEANERAR